MSKAKTIGPIIKLDGEKEYKQAISGINTSMKLLASEMKKSTAQFGDNAKSLKGLKEQTKLTAESVETQKSKVETLRGALENSKKLYGENSEKTKQWQISLNNAESELAKTEKKLSELNKQTTGIGKLKTAFSEWKNKLGDIKGKLAPVTDGLKKMSSAAAKVAKTTFKAVGAGIAAVGTAAVAAGKKLWDFANEAAAAGDSIDKQSQKMQVSTDEYQKLSYAAQLSGTNINVVQNAQKKLMSSGSKLGITEALKQCADAADPAAAATEMFGAKVAQELLPMLNSGSKGITDMMNNAEKYGMVMSKDAVGASAKFQDSLTTLKGTFSTVKNNIFSNLLPGLTAAMDGFTGLLTGAEGSKEKILEGVTSMIDSFKTILPRLQDVFSVLIGAIAEIAPQLINTLAIGLIDNLSLILNACFEIIQTLAQTLLQEDNLQKIIQAAIELVITLVTGIADNIDLIIDAAFTIIDTLMTSLVEPDNLNKLISSTITIVSKITTGILQHLPEIIKAGFQLIKGLIKGLWDNRGLIWKAIKDLVRELLNTFKNLLGIHSPSSIFAGFGKNLVQGLWNGLSNSLKWIRDKIEGWVGNVTNFIKNLFGIHSPSTLFRDEVGKNLGLGIGVGFENSMKSVKEQMEKSMPKKLKTDVKLDIDTDIDSPDKSSLFRINKIGNIGRRLQNVSNNQQTTSNRNTTVNVHFHIDKVENGTDRDIDKFVDKVSKKLYDKIKRDTEVFA